MGAARALSLLTLRSAGVASSGALRPPGHLRAGTMGKQVAQTARSGATGRRWVALIPHSRRHRQSSATKPSTTRCKVSNKHKHLQAPPGEPGAGPVGGTQRRPINVFPGPRAHRGEQSWALRPASVQSTQRAPTQSGSQASCCPSVRLCEWKGAANSAPESMGLLNTSRYGYGMS